jgi:hypothetical protein
MAGYSSASWAKWCARNGCITKDTPPPFNLPSTTFGYTPSCDLNSIQRGVDWQMKIDDARCKLKSVYPKIKL